MKRKKIRVIFVHGRRLSYRTSAIITRSLYIFYPIFLCGSYCRVVCNAERIFQDFFPPKLYRDANTVSTTQCLSYIHFGGLKSRGSFGKSTLFLKRSQYISLDFYVLRKSQKAKCGS